MHSRKIKYEQGGRQTSKEKERFGIAGKGRMGIFPRAKPLRRMGEWNKVPRILNLVGTRG